MNPETNGILSVIILNFECNYYTWHTTQNYIRICIEYSEILIVKYS